MKNILILLFGFCLNSYAITDKEAQELIKKKEEFLQKLFKVPSDKKIRTIEFTPILCDCGNRFGGFTKTNFNGHDVHVAFSFNDLKVYHDDRLIEGYKAIEPLCYWEKQSDADKDPYLGGKCAVIGKKIKAVGTFTKAWNFVATKIYLPNNTKTDKCESIL